MIHLDTNFLIDALGPGSMQATILQDWLASGEPLGISSVAWGEFLCGPLSPAAETFARGLFPAAEPLERADAEKAASLFNLTGRRSKTYPTAASPPSPCAHTYRWRRAIEPTSPRSLHTGYGSVEAMKREPVCATKEDDGIETVLLK
jgi:hypothetical protein